MAAARRTAVVLLNLGGPGAPGDIEPFLRTFFSDPAILPLPWFLRRPLAALIARRRARGAAREAYGALGGASPLLANTRAQAAALEAALNSPPIQEGDIDAPASAAGPPWAAQQPSARPAPPRGGRYAPFAPCGPCAEAAGKGADASKAAPGPEVFKVFVCMRYWHPMAPEVAAAVRAWGAGAVVLLPLYPQFARATTGSALAAWAAAAPDIPARGPCCYPTHPGFVEACADRVAAALTPGARVLFSAHGLPEREIRRGDPYQAQCTATARAVAARLNLPDWAECYQSRVGPLRWIGPPIEDELARAAADGVPVVVFPHAFTQEHVETLVELDMEYAHKAAELGVPGYARAATVGTHPAFIGALADMARAAPAGPCPCGFGRGILAPPWDTSSPPRYCAPTTSGGGMATR